MRRRPVAGYHCTVLLLLAILSLSFVNARSIHTATGLEHGGSPSSKVPQAAGATLQQQLSSTQQHVLHSRALQQATPGPETNAEAGLYVITPDGPVFAEAPPADTAAAVAAALGSAFAPAGDVSTGFPANSASATGAENQQPQSDAAATEPAIVVEPAPEMQEQQQAGSATAEGVSSQSSVGDANQVLNTPSTPTAQQQQQQLQQQPNAVVSDDDSNSPPNDNAELLPPPPTTSPAPPPPPPPPPSNDGSSNGTDSTSPPTEQPPQQPPAPDQGSDSRPWLNPALPVSERISSLLKALTLEEKVPMMIHGQAGVPRLGLKPFQFWTECLHGHQERYDGALPTLFPQPLMLAATFDPTLAYQVFTAISDELRAKSNVELEKSGIHKFLTCWTPHINLFKDPRWGRGSETFGEDPFLTAAFAQHIVKGLQGEEPSITKVVATCKHFLGYGLEGAEGVSRYSHNINLAPQDLTDTDLPPFEACIQAASGKGIMCSYNAVNGEPACASSTLLQTLLRQGLGFDGYVVSDCNAVAALTWGHRTAAGYPEAAAASVKAGVDMLCDRPEVVKEAVAAGTLTEADLDQALSKTLLMRFITGQFDPPSANPWSSLPVSTVNSKEHRKLARQVVQKGAVLLKNDMVPGTSTPLLPLDKAALSKVCITGPLADSAEHMMGNYYGKWDADAALTPRKAIKEELGKAGVNVSYSRGMDIVGEIHYDWPLESTLEACAGADVGLVFVGGSMVELNKNGEGAFKPATEGEGLDRLSLELPGRQPDLIKALARRAPDLPLVVVLMHGGGLDVAWMQAVPQVKAILSVPFPGQEGGRGVSSLLFGGVSPSGRLPITWYRSSYTAAVSPLDLNMRPDGATGHPGRTYRFLSDSSHVLYPFGYGLSYTTFSYSGLRVLNPGEPGCLNPGTAPAMCITLTVTNTGGTGYKKPAGHVVPLYLSHTSRGGVEGNPWQALRGVSRTEALKPGQSQQVTFTLSRRDFSMSRAADGAVLLTPGVWKVSVGVWDAPLVEDLAASTVVATRPHGQLMQPAAGGFNPAAAAAGAGMVGEPAAAAGVDTVAYTGGPVALPVATGRQNEAGVVDSMLGAGGADGGASGRAGDGSSRSKAWTVVAGDSSSSSSKGVNVGDLTLPADGGVSVDSQRGLALTIDIPEEMRAA